MRQIERLTTGTAQECEIQVGFVRLPVSVAGDSLVLEPVLKEGVIAAIPEEHPLAGGGDLPVSALAQEPFIMIARHREPGLYDHYISLCRQAGFGPRVVQEANRIHTIIGLVASGMGVAFAPASIEQLRRPGVVYRKLTGPVPELEMAAVWRKENDDLPEDWYKPDKATFLARERRRLGEWWYRQEYYAEFLDAQTQAFRREDIEAAFSEELEAWDL